jgi:hypothetical protein
MVSINETEARNGYFQKRLQEMWQSLRSSDSYSGVQIHIYRENAVLRAHDKVLRPVYVLTHSGKFPVSHYINHQAEKSLNLRN